MARFVIDLGDVDMSKKAQAELNEKLQSTALAHVAGLRFEKPIAVRFPGPIIWGIILRPDFDGLRGAEKQLEEALGGLR